MLGYHEFPVYVAELVIVIVVVVIIIIIIIIKIFLQNFCTLGSIDPES